ncbi:Fic family protein, partial [Pseudomonas sp. NW5]|uniref:Fic family protein n=1 Tax=Pseudomonas sp. NW5 TaxID=2934934 RepID=UPI0032E3F3C1|nr:hypothetical protein [Pseudomonas sp. NW5]
DAEFVVRHGNTVPERSGVALSFCGRQALPNPNCCRSSPAAKTASTRSRSTWPTRMAWLPGFAGEVTEDVAGEVRALHLALVGEMKRSDLQRSMGLVHEEHFRQAYLKSAQEAGVIEMTVPDKPRSRLQKYHLTAKGRRLQQRLKE